MCDTIASQSAREILIELKRSEPNRLTITSPDVVWVDGKIVQIRNYLKRYEARLNYYYRKYGLFLNSIIFLSMLVWFPSIQDIRSRLYVVLFVVTVLTMLLILYRRLLPNTQIYVREKKASFWRRNRDHMLVYTITAIISLAISRLDKTADYLNAFIRFVLVPDKLKKLLGAWSIMLDFVIFRGVVGVKSFLSRSIRLWMRCVSWMV